MFKRIKRGLDGIKNDRTVLAGTHRGESTGTEASRCHGVHADTAAVIGSNSAIRPVVLCGGSGTRLWPLSRALRPKQLLSLLGNETLLQQTVLRLSDTELFVPPIVVCSEQQRFAVAEQLSAAGIEPAAIVLEPVGRNTAPAIAAAALLVDPSELLLVVPSDGHVTNVDSYIASIEAGAEAARDRWLVSFGVEPSRPETAYGYIREGHEKISADVMQVDRFHEKPDLATAQAYLSEGGYLWNAGMFLFRAEVYLEELDRHAPEILGPVRGALSAARRDTRFVTLDPPAIAKARAASIDHAVMERTERAAVTRLKASWSAVGSWQELWRTMPHDVADNVLIGDVIDCGSRGCYIHSEGRLTATLGLCDHVVIATTDTVLVVPRERSQEVKVLVDRLKELDRPEHKIHARVFRPWGYYECIDQGEGFQVKRIMVKPGGRLSLQRHKHRSEHWTVVSGRAQVTVGSDVRELAADQSAHIPVGAIHRLENFGSDPVYLIEVQCGDYLGEDDIERLEDVYHRVGGQAAAAE